MYKVYLLSKIVAATLDQVIKQFFFEAVINSTNCFSSAGLIWRAGPGGRQGPLGGFRAQVIWPLEKPVAWQIRSTLMPPSVYNARTHSFCSFVSCL